MLPKIPRSQDLKDKVWLAAVWWSLYRIGSTFANSL